MDFINDIVETVSKAVECAGKKGGELLNRGKIRFALANLQSDLDELYEKLGKIRYEEIVMGKVDAEEEENILSEIDSVKTDMEILKAELVTSQIPVCPACGKSVKKNASFCSNCGEKL